MKNAETLPPLTECKTIKHQLFRPIILALMGAFLGFIDKYSGDVSWLRFDTSVEFWLVLITLVSVFSRTKWTAAIHSSIFLFAMVISYYLTYYITLGFIPTWLFLGWLLFALLASIYGFVIWHAKNNGVFAAFAGAIPIAILLVHGYYFIPDLFFCEPINDLPQPYFGIDVLSGFNFFSAILLFLLFLKTSKSPIALIAFILLLFFLFKQVSIFQYLYVL